MSKLERLTAEMRAWSEQLGPAAAHLIGTARRIENVARSLPFRVDPEDRETARKTARQLWEAVQPCRAAAAWAGMAERVAKHWIGRQGAGASSAGGAAPRDAPLRPLGFEGEHDFQEFVGKLQEGLAGAGFGDTRIAFQGSAVTGRKYLTGRPFGQQSDYDIALIGSGLLERAKQAGIATRSGGTRTIPLQQHHVNRLGLRDTQKNLQRSSHRPVNFMIFESEDVAFGRGPSLPTEGK